MEPILEIGRRRHLPIIEDAAQSIGATYKGRKAGSMGAIGCFSFFPSKNLGGAGDGGMIVTQDPQLAERIDILRVHGSKPKYHHQVIGLNSRLDSIQAAILSVKLRYLEEWSQKREQNARFYNEHLKAAPGVVTPYIESFNRSIYNQYVIGSEIYYPIPLHLQACFKDLGYQPGDFPEAERAARETIALPIYPELTSDQKRYVIEAVKGFLLS
jgi:dTDP-4-amino-4,6-dideoxygalactose transaminase